VKSPLHDAGEQVVVAPGYEHCVAEVPAHAPTHVAWVPAHAGRVPRGAPVIVAQVPVLLGSAQP
jgi:hypothetical protein